MQRSHVANRIGKWILGAAAVAVGVAGGDRLLHATLLQRFVDHCNECHDELGIAEKLRGASTNRDVDAVLREYATCARAKGNLLDQQFSTPRIDQSMVMLKAMNGRAR